MATAAPPVGRAPNLPAARIDQTRPSRRSGPRGGAGPATAGRNHFAPPRPGGATATLDRRRALWRRAGGWCSVRITAAEAPEGGGSNTEGEHGEARLDRRGPQRPSRSAARSTAGRAGAARGRPRGTLQDALLERERREHRKNEGNALALPVHVPTKRRTLRTYLEMPAQMALPQRCPARDRQLLPHVATGQRPGLAPARQRAPRLVHERAHLLRRAFEDLGHLSVAQLLELGQHQGGTLILGQPAMSLTNSRRSLRRSTSSLSPAVDVGGRSAGSSRRARRRSTQRLRAVA
jgi:hypothetical protein